MCLHDPLPRSGKRNLPAKTAPTLDSNFRKCDSLGANYEKGFRDVVSVAFFFCFMLLRSHLLSDSPSPAPEA
jgi:hypothetical protein